MPRVLWPINDLIEKAFAMENKEVTVQGETIGEALERDEYAWININDNTNAIGVWVKLDELTQIKYYGDYKNKGDIVKVTGVFHRACTEHGGDVDIHCSKIEIVETGHPMNDLISSHKIIITLSLVLAAGIVTAAYLSLKNKSL